MLKGHSQGAAHTVRVLHTVAALNEAFGGPSRTVPALCSALVPFAEWVGLASQDFGSGRGKVILPEASQVSLAFARGVYIQAARLAVAAPARHITKLAADGCANIFHDHGVWQPFNHSVALVAGQLGAKRVVSPRGMLMKWSMRRSTARKSLLWRLFQREDLASADGFVATSGEEAADIRQLGFTQPVAVIPNAVRLPSADATVSKVGRTAVFLSRIHPKKGLINLVNAWSLASPKGWRLIIAGPDEAGHSNQVRTEISRLGLNEVIEVRGEVPESDKFRFLAQSDFAVLPSESENFGMVVAEAMSVGVPVIASTGTPWATLRDGGLGWWVKNSPVDLASAIEEAVALSPDGLRRMGQAGRRFVEENYSWSAVAASTSRFYLWLLGAGEAPDFVMEPVASSHR